VLADATTRFGLTAAKSRVIFNGVEPEPQKGNAPALPFSRYVLGLGRVVPKKGFDLLLSAFARIAMEFPDVGMVIGGDGGERERLERTAASIGSGERVHFAGPLNRAAVASLMRGAEVFVMPSRLEPFGIVILEAWRAGVPAIATSRGGASEFVEDGRTGLVVDPSDTPALAGAIRSLLRNADLREALAREARRELPRFSWGAIARNYEDVYKSLARLRDA
jgi:glycogen(starch) synthase